MQTDNLPIDILKKIFNKIDYIYLLKLRIVNKRFNNLLTINKCKIIYFNQKTKKYFYRWYYLTNAKNYARRLFIEKLLYDIDFRKKYIYIHLEPSPHICLNFNNLGLYFKKIFHSHEYFIRYFELNYSSIFNSVLNMQSNTNNLDDIINNVINTL